MALEYKVPRCASAIQSKYMYSCNDLFGTFQKGKGLTPKAESAARSPRLHTVSLHLYLSACLLFMLLALTKIFQQQQHFPSVPTFETLAWILCCSQALSLGSLRRYCSHRTVGLMVKFLSRSEITRLIKSSKFSAFVMSSMSTCVPAQLLLMPKTWH